MKKTATGRTGACAAVRNRILSIAEESEAGTLPADIGRHLDSCPECASLVRDFVQAWKSWAEPDIPPAGGSLFPALRRRIETLEDPRVPIRRFRLRAWRILRPVGAAALLLIGILAGYEMGLSGKRLSPPPDPSADRILDGFKNIPPGSPADFLIALQSEKDDLR